MIPNVLYLKVIFWKMLDLNTSRYKISPARQWKLAETCSMILQEMSHYMPVTVQSKMFSETGLAELEGVLPQEVT